MPLSRQRDAGRRPRWAVVGAVAAVLLAGCAAEDPPPPAPAVATAPPPAPAGPPEELVDGLVLAPAAPVSLTIPALDVETGAFAPLGVSPDGAMDVPADAATVGWFTGAPAPGALGPAVLAAHVDWQGATGIFHELHELRPGDEVRVGRADGTTATFRVTDLQQHAKDAFPTDAVYGPIDHAGLRLITCGGRFDDAADSYRDNIVVFAELVGSAPA